MAKQKKKKDDDWLSWAVIVFLFVVNLWPVALIVLLAKLFGGDGKKPPEIGGAGMASSDRTGGAGKASGGREGEKTPASGRAKGTVQRMTRTPVTKKSTAKWLKIIGAILAAVGLLGMAGPMEAIFWSDYWVSLWLPELLQFLALTIGGLAMLGKGVSMDRQLKRYPKYLAVLGDRESMGVEELSRTLGYPVRRTEKDLQSMIDKGYFGGTAYLNVEQGRLFRSGAAEEEFRKRQAQPPKETEEGYSGILRQIRRANDAIADPVLSAKIDRLESITARIFQAMEADPKKRERMDTFLNYYLPTTQKLLDSYAEFEAAGVEGENLRQAKSRIEATMDKIVQGFEHQLDELYRSDALDVDSDIRVMETMLRWDTASAERDFGAAVPPASARETEANRPAAPQNPS